MLLFSSYFSQLLNDHRDMTLKQKFTRRLNVSEIKKRKQRNTNKTCKINGMIYYKYCLQLYKPRRLKL